MRLLNTWLPKMSTQKALIMPVKHGNWEIRTVAIPRPGPKDVLVKIISAALNPVDWKIHTYDYFGSEYPFVCGSDGAGTVQEVGADVSNVAKGDKM